ncbi:TPA: hypothetical protein ACGB2R_002591 [Klebsiella aerogenes]|nr:hypothetical protein [Klebsiella aerogenes]
MKDENDPKQLEEMTKKLTEYLRKKSLVLPTTECELIVKLEKGEITWVAFQQGAPHTLH